MSSIQQSKQLRAAEEAENNDFASIEQITKHDDLMSSRPNEKPPHKPLTRDALENLGMYFT